MASELNASQLFSFLTQLAANNNREWFKQHKDQYDTLRQQWLDDVQSLINLISQWDDSVHGLNVADAVYRIYRDIRFSPDKSPYKTYFSACFGRGGRRCQSFAHCSFATRPQHGGRRRVVAGKRQALRHAKLD